MSDPRTVIWPTQLFLGWVPADLTWLAIMVCFALAWVIAYRLGKRNADRFPLRLYEDER